MSVKQTIMTAMLALLNSITTESGYSITVNGVYEWPDSDIPNNINHAIVIRDARDEIIDQDEQEHRIEYEIVYRSIGNTSPDTLRAVQQDILTAVSAIEENSAVKGAEYEYSDMEVEKEQKRMAFIAMYFSVYYITDEWNI